MALSTETIVDLLPDTRVVLSIDPVGGGCISEAFRVDLSRRDGESSSVLVKVNRGSFADNFACEAEGLRAISAVGEIGVADPMVTRTIGGQTYLLTRWIEAGRTNSRFYEEFGSRLAKHHIASRSSDDEHGWPRDNYLGASQQPNTPADDWIDFVAQKRLGFQVRLASDAALMDGRLHQDVTQIITRLDELLAGRQESVSLLHGDLWSGNYLCDQHGAPVLIDPAVYRGCAEAEFGMINLFGSCPPVFDEAYLDVNPFADGWRRRVKIYVLYHLLNHLNLFGTSYASPCQSMASEILRA